jgi:UDP-N-acetylmuramate--L-alanine ligase
LSSSERRRSWYHFVGVAGSGMSALAQFHVQGGGRATGSDRAFDRGERERTRRLLAEAGVEIVPQDGSAPAPGCQNVVASTAVEDSIPDLRTARRLGVPLLHRSELLARYVRERRTVAVTGTSGKSTTAAMIFAILRGTGRDPSLLTGGNLRDLEAEGHLGNAWAGRSNLLVIEADESDGSLVRYEPWVGILLNLRLDHKEPAELARMFAIFRERTRGPFIVGEDPALRSFSRGATVFGLSAGCDVRAERIAVKDNGAEFMVEDTRFHLRIPGRYNVLNAAAAIAACWAAGVKLAEMVEPLAAFGGVARRFQPVGTANGIEVVDDFAHNPDKIAASLAAAQERLQQHGAGRLLVVFQPHGFGPTRFLKDALVTALARGLRSQDRLWMPEIYYAGGTVIRDISSRDIVEGVQARDCTADFVSERAELVPAVADAALEGDLILVMGARDPSLTDFCHAILDRLRSHKN